MAAAAIEMGLNRWPGLAGARAHLINISENHTFAIAASDGGRYILRLHRPGYQSAVSIKSELAWMQALAAATGVATPTPLPGSDGGMVQVLEVDGARRHAVLFAFDEGREPGIDEPLGDIFVQLGAISALAHEHVRTWTPPPGFYRPTWDIASILDPDGPWGDWRRSPGVVPAMRPVLDRLDARLREDFAAYGTGPDRFGLIHADMRLANLLVHEGRVRVIDFDDSGLCWFVYDFAAAISFYESHPAVPELRRRWIEGYTSIRPLSADDLLALDAAVLLRRMALLAWIGTHGEVPFARSLRPYFAQGTLELAKKYLG